jgi:signal transduction histidine kinase
VLLSLGLLREQPEKRYALLDVAINELAAGLQELRELASGLHPAVLSERGLTAALEALTLRTPLPVELEALPAERLPDRVEAAAYYVVAEALANVQKHAGAHSVVVRAATDTRGLTVEVVDDGVGGADVEGSGLRGLADRVETLGGRLSVESPATGGTRLVATIPLGPSSRVA